MDRTIAIPGGDIVEAADSVSPGSAAFRIDDAKSSHPYYCSGEDYTDTVQLLIGSNTADPTGDGSLQRDLPMTHPQFPWMFCSSVGGVGFGVPEVQIADGYLTGTKTVTELFSLYPDYTLNCEFTQRPYYVLNDSFISPTFGVYYDDDGNEKFVQYVNEYDRYVEIDEKYDPKIIIATQGQLVFHTDSKQMPDGAAFTGTPRLPYPETMLTMRWHQVPYRYISSRNSYLKSLAHRVNQLPFEIQDYYFLPGQLLYLGFGYRRYTPPFPNLEEDEDVGGPGAVTAKLEKWVDVDLQFAFVDREAQDPPVLPNPNWIAAHHNCLPFFGPNFASKRRGFHYACSFNPRARDDRNYWIPLYLSHVLQLLFTDPDVPQS